MSNTTCFHCGDPVVNDAYKVDDKLFCCNGCKSVYLLLSGSGLNDFYTYEQQAGNKPTKIDVRKYDFLDVPEIQEQFIDFKDDNTIHTTLYLPKIHCSSCIYLLENLSQIHEGVKHCQSDFTKKEALLIFNPQEIKFSELAVLLEKIGYPPNFEDRSQAKKGINKKFLYKLGVAGFAFGSIMLWSFPEYLGIADTDPGVRSFTSYLSFIISLPVILYAASEYYISAFKAIRFKKINIDVPITIGIFALYLQSCYSIFFEGNPGYMDSFAGFIFFLLIGKWFQNRTYRSIVFDRDQSAFFPVAVIRIQEGQEEIIPIDKVAKGDHILIRNKEVVPCDAEVLEESILVDYSFVTGESDPVTCKKGQIIYAGGRIVGQHCQLKVKHENKKSRLSGLWAMHQPKKESTSDRLSTIFLFAVLIIALGTAITWFFIDRSSVLQITVAVLIVACPCALALSRPFTYGNTMRLLGRKGMYLKHSSVIESIQEITAVVFDKTGTLTSGSYGKVDYVGKTISTEDLAAIYTLFHSSTHPIAQGIFKKLQDQKIVGAKLDHFEEIPGKGMRAIFKGKDYWVGSAEWIGAPPNNKEETVAYIKINNEIIGKYVFQSSLRSGLAEKMSALKEQVKTHVVSGDSAKDEELIQKNLNPHAIAFHQLPEAKVSYIEQLQQQGHKVMMVGDGLNDLGALKQADVGVAVAEDVSQFSPSADVILEADQISNMSIFLRQVHHAKRILKVCFTFSILYNFIGLTFAVSGALSPLIAAVLMPISSITIVGLSTIVFIKKS